MVSFPGARINLIPSPILGLTKRHTRSIAISILLLVLFVVVLFNNPYYTPYNGAGPYAVGMPTGDTSHTASPTDGIWKEIVVAKMKGQDTTWIEKDLAADGWKPNIYVTNDKHAPLTVPANKGREAMAYLTYIIDNYSNLPTLTVFMHALRYQWHNDDPLYDGLRVMRSLQLPYLLSQGYQSLRCVWTLGCPREIATNAASLKWAAENGRHTMVAFPKAFEELFGANETLPLIVGVTCCAQFAVTRDKIQRRSLAEYKHYRNWLLKTDINDDTSGRVLEYMWHMIFGYPAVHCPDVKQCYCKLFGQCMLKGCKENMCGKNRWPWPKSSALPKGWPNKWWDGKTKTKEELDQFIVDALNGH